MLSYRNLDPLLAALANPTRRSLFEMLCLEEEETVTALAEPLPVSRQAVLQHLAMLEKSGVIHTEKRERTRWCSIEPQALDVLEQWLNQCRVYFARRYARRQPSPFADPEAAQRLRSLIALMPLK